MAFSLHDVAPRLARARDQWLEEEAQRRREERTQDRRDAKRASEILQVDRLVAHRELQFLRAAATRNPKYVAARARKLAAAKRARARLD